jgi:carboxypeptidase family protein
MERRVMLPWIPLLIPLLFVGSVVGMGYWVLRSEHAEPSEQAEVVVAEAPAETGPEADPEEPESDPAPAEIEATLTVQVTDAAGKPASGATVRVLRPYLYRTPRGWRPLADAAPPDQVLAGEDGVAVLKSGNPFWGVHVFAHAEDVAGTPKGRAIYQTAEDDRPFGVALAPHGSITVHVKDLAGRPVKDADVHALVPLAVDSRLSASGDYGLVLRAPSPEAGTYAFAPLPLAAERRLRLIVERAGFRTQRTEVSAGTAAGEPVRVQLVRSLTARGRLVESDGTPLAGARVALAPASRLPDAPPARVLTDGDGAFELADVPETGGMLEVDTGYLTPAEIPFPETAPDAESLELGDLVVAPTGRISGRVVDSDGTPVPGAIVFISTEASPGSRSRGRTDADGGFSLAALGPGAHRVFATEGHVPPHWEARSGVVEGAKPGGTPSEIHVVAVRLLRVEIAFRSGDAPTGSDWTVSIHALPADAERDGSETPHLYRGIRSVRFTCERIGPHVVSVEIPGFVVGTGKAEIVADGEAVVSVTLRRKTRE